jgi:GTP-binding protein
MADGVLLVVDSVEGPKPQTRFVLDKALKRGMQALVVINKIDRPAARPDYVIDKCFDLFCELGATDAQTDFRVVYASGLLGKAGMTEDLADDLGPLFDAVMEGIPPPKCETTGEEPDTLQALISNIDYDDFKGKMGIARITNGSVKAGQSIALQQPGKEKKKGKISKLFVFDNLGQREVESAAAGDIIM